MELEDNELCFKSTTLKEILKELQDDKRFVIGLHGKRGSGKTTLVKAVGEEAKSLKIFDEVLFATVSQNPNIRMIQDQIAESINLKFCSKSEFGRAAEIKSSLANKKRILVILDDVPTKFELEDIGIPCSDRRCKFLLTTRHKQNCTLTIGKRVVGCQTMVPMSPLSEEDSWMLLKKHAGIHDDTTNHRLLNVAKEVAFACNKLPGTIIDLASSFKNKHVPEWNLLLNSLRHSTASYQIFLSFCRKDPALTFVCNLYEELKEKGLKTFMDRELCIGDQISTKRIKAIEDSRLSIIVLSKNYLRCAQCIEELVHILKCKKSIKQLVWLIYYNVETVYLMYLANDCSELVEELVARSHKNREKIEQWESAFSEVSRMTGWFYRERITQRDFLIKQVVDTINDVKHYLYIQSTDTDSDSDDMIEQRERSNANPEGTSDQLLMALEDNGLCFNSATLMELSKELQDDSIYIIGLYGQQGSGKTTLVEAVRDKAKSLKIFDIVLFATVSQNPNIRSIQEQIASLLNLKFDKENKSRRAMKIESTLEGVERILVILDDVPAEFDPEDVGISCNDQQCKFLLTTRSRQDCTLIISEKVTHCQKMIPMRHLSEETTWKLLQEHSGIKEEDDNDSSSNPLTVAKEIAFNYKWLPGTIKKIGTSLKGKPLEEWEGLLDSLKHSKARYQIFLSFRGLDTRDQFTSSLYDELKKNGFKTFMDDKLKHGDQISTELIKAIEDSRLSIIVLSENYADSAWCLEELVHILECKETKKQLVWPIFYKVEPTDVRHQTKGVGIAMAKLEGKKDPEKIKIWKDALFNVCQLTGRTYTQGMSQPKFIEEIIKSANESKNYLYLRSMDME